MATNNAHNLYSPVDVVDRDLPRTERVFISHRSFDKPLAAAFAALFEGLGVHYWFDREDEDTRRAASLGMSIEQLNEGLDRFLIVPDISHNRRLATREEFKAEFDRIQHSLDDHERRSLGVLVNPLFGFTPTDRPVYWRVLALQQRFHQAIVNQTSWAIFDGTTRLAIERYIDELAE